jgi:hypothetical protein
MKINIAWQQKSFAQKRKSALNIGSLVLTFLFSLQCTANCGVTDSTQLTIECLSISSQPLNTTLCGTAGSTASLSVSTNVPATSYSWQYRLVTTANPNPAWITISSANAAVYSNYNTANLGITRTTTLPMTGTQYRVVMAGTCGELISTVASLKVVSTTKGGTISVASTNVCLGSSLTFTLTGYTGTSLQWQSAPTATGTFTAIAGATGSSYTVTNAQLNSNKSYRVLVTNSCNGTTAFSTVKTIIVNPLAVAGTAIGGGSICSGDSDRLSVIGQTGVVQWQYSTDGTNFINAPKAADGQTSPFTTTSASSAIASYMIGGISANLYFRAKVTSGSCAVAYTNTVHYTLASQALVGTVTQDDGTICKGTATTLHLSSALGTITWEKSIDYTAATPTWTPISSSNVLTYLTQTIMYNTAYRAKVTIGSCSTVYSNIVYVNVYGKPVAKSLLSNATTPSGTSLATALCVTDGSKVLTINAGYSGAIQWQWSTTSTTIGFTDLAGETGTSYTITNASVGPNYYRVQFTNECGVQAFSPAATAYYKECVLVKQLASSFEVNAHPNPYADSFNIALLTSSQEHVSVEVYDMIGKLVAHYEFTPIEASTMSIGRNYPSGIYNVVVTQGENRKTLRVVKR